MGVLSSFLFFFFFIMKPENLHYNRTGDEIIPLEQ